MLFLFSVFAWFGAVDGYAAGTFLPTGSMAAPRAWHQATLLRNGRVLITGAGTPNAELYDPDSGKFIPTGNMAVGRLDHTATLLQDGRVLVVGGNDQPYPTVSQVASAEIYDPLTGTFAATGDAVGPASHHTATLLSSGKVHIAGGYVSLGPGPQGAILRPFPQRRPVPGQVLSFSISRRHIGSAAGGDREYRGLGKVSVASQAAVMRVA